MGARAPVADNRGMGTTAVPLERADIVRLVDAFYDRVRVDPVLGPVFNPAVHDWDAHKATLVRFWSSIMLGTREYRGNPMAAHLPHPIVDGHFGHWLALWRDTAHEVLASEQAEAFHERARRIAQSLRYVLGLDSVRPVPGLGKRAGHGV